MIYKPFHNRLRKPAFALLIQTLVERTIECHITMSLLEQKPVCMRASADTAPERQFLPDVGYIGRTYFVTVNKAGGFYLEWGLKSLNPTIIGAWRGTGEK